MRTTLFEGSSQAIPSLMELLELITRDDILYEDVSEEEGNETIFKSKKPAFLKDYPVVDKMVEFIEIESAKSCDYSRKYEERAVDLSEKTENLITKFRANNNN
jgi:hypothetical protein